MNITFWGATDGVTGSMTVLSLPQGNILVDCGLNQGGGDSKEKNLLIPPFKASEIEAIILTHAHLDHCGYIPKLVKEGFRGSIICTPATMKLAKVIMSDSARLQENDDNSSAPPLYTTADVTVATSLFQTKAFENTFKLAGAQITFKHAGHILGASSVLIQTEEKSIVFSGDLGRLNDPIIPNPTRSPKADMVVMESTYGGKERVGILENDSQLPFPSATFLHHNFIRCLPVKTFHRAVINLKLNLPDRFVADVF